MTTDSIPTATPVVQPVLRFTNSDDPDTLRAEVSACCFDERGRLWCGTDELNGLSCLTPQPAAASAAATFGAHRYVDLTTVMELPDGADREIDVEGMDYGEGRIWFVGSHTSTRRGPDAADTARRQLKALGDVRPRLNRFALGYLEPAQGAEAAADPIRAAPRVAQLPIGKRGNKLSEALRDDEHLAPFLRCRDAGHGWPGLAAKENGFDIEGLAARGTRLFLGLRGPVLRGWAVLLEVAVDDGNPPKLTLAKIGRRGRRYRKHLLELGGMGIRDLCWQDNDLLLLTGPTMDITGRQTLWRLRDAASLDDDSLTRRGRDLEPLFDLPFHPDGDKAEGVAPWYPSGGAVAGGQGAGVLVVYDSPVAARRVGADGVKADVFGLPVEG